MGRDDYYDDRRPRPRSKRDEDDRAPYYPPKKPRSGAVMSVAVLNFVVGPLVLLFGMCGVLTTLTPWLQAHFIGVPGGLGESNVAQGLFIVAIFAWGTGAFVTAVGLLCRAGWSRMLGLLLGGGAALAGLLYLSITLLFLFGDADSESERARNVVFSAARTVFFLGYCTWTYIVLLHPRRVEEFR